MRNTATRTIAIERSADDAFDFISDPRNLPRWAAAESVIDADQGWHRFQTPHGAAQIRFRASKPFGILDHDYIDATGRWEVHARVVADGEACLLMLTLFQPAAMSDDDFARQVCHVEQELAGLKNALEFAAAPDEPG